MKLSVYTAQGHCLKLMLFFFSYSIGGYFFTILRDSIVSSFVDYEETTEKPLRMFEETIEKTLDLS
jgi:hypothetical protein